MDDNPALPREYMHAGSAGMPAWQAIASTIAAVLLALLFFVSGAWKLVYVFEWSQLMGQFQVPSNLKLPFTIAVGTAEMLGSALIIVPRYRRWGSILIGLLLIAFMVYIGFKYNDLVGKDCSCFPLIKRTVGPWFFVGDAVMLGLAVIAGMWTQASHSIRGALVLLGVIGVFAGVSYGINANANTGLKAPDSITVDGKPFALDSGNVFLFFFDPECMYCYEAAQHMSKLNWKDTKVVALPTRVPQFAAGFLKDSKFKVGVSPDAKMLRETFKFRDPPYGVALHNGRQKAMVPTFDGTEPEKTVRPFGFVQ